MKNKEKSEEIALKYAREYTVSRNDSHKQNILFKESSIIECEKAAMEMAEWKDSQIRDILMKYTLWLNKRGFFTEDLQCDFGHQIDTFLEMSKNK